MRPARPDVLSVIVGADGYDDLVARAEYLDRIHGMDEAVVGRVRDLRDQVQAHRRSACARAKDRIEAARDAIAAEEQALAERPRRRAERQSALVAARGDRVAALEQIDDARGGAGRLVAAIQGKIAAPARRLPARRRCRPGRSRPAAAAA